LIYEIKVETQANSDGFESSLPIQNMIRIFKIAINKPCIIHLRICVEVYEGYCRKSYFFGVSDEN
jgi:hypothetical protein